MSKGQLILAIIEFLILAVILNGIVVTLLLWVVNHFWNCPEWMALTKAHVVGFTAVIVLIQILFGNNSQSK